MGKRYYWFKMKDDFCERPAILWLEEQKGGVEAIWLYTKLCCKTLQNDGKLYEIIADRVVNHNANIISRLTGTKIKTVEKCLELLKKIGLISEEKNGGFYLPDLRHSIGSEGASAARVRRFRETHVDDKPKPQSVTLKQKCNGEKDREKETDKKKKTTSKKNERISNPYFDDKGNPKIFYMENVSFTPSQYETLLKKYGEQALNDMMEILDSYKGSKNAYYASDYHVMHGWVKREYTSRWHKKKPATVNEAVQKALEIMGEG